MQRIEVVVREGDAPVDVARLETFVATLTPAGRAVLVAILAELTAPV